MTENLAAESSRPALMSLAVDQINPSPYQARKDFDDDSIKGLAESMNHEGLIEPIVVRLARVGETENRRFDEAALAPDRPLADSPIQTYELVSGERRLRAAKLLGWQTIEAKVIQTTSEAEAAAKGLIENIQRENLNPIEEAQGFRALNFLDPKYWNQARIASACGRNPSYISQAFKLLELPATIQENIRALKFSRSHALELMRLPTPEKQLEVADQIIGHLTWEETRALVTSILDRNVASKNNPERAPIPDPLVAYWEKLAQDPALPIGAWKVAYNSNGWTFWVAHAAPGTPTLPAAWLAIWFRAMSKAFKEEAQDVDRRLDEVQAQALKDLEKLVPGGAAALEQAKKDAADARADGIRLPKTAEEWAALNKAGEEGGPEAAYAWIGGPGHEGTLQMKGKTWDDLGFGPDAASSIPIIVDLIRQQQAAS